MQDVPGTTEITADSDYYVDGTAVDVASCDSPNVATLGLSLACDGGTHPTDTPRPGLYTFTAADLSAISGNLAGGSLDFNVIQNYYGAVNAGQLHSISLQHLSRVPFASFRSAWQVLHCFAAAKSDFPHCRKETKT